MNLKRKTFSTTKILMHMVALISLLQSGCASLPLFQKDPNVKNIQHSTSPKLRMKNLSSSEKVFFEKLIKEYALKSSSAKKLLKELEKQNASMEIFEKKRNKNNLFSAGESSEDTLRINRELLLKKYIPVEDTFFHEAEHVAHLKCARKNGINAHSFASLDDVYIYSILLEALAYRKSALCREEYKLSPFLFKEAFRRADKVFIKRLRTDDMAIEERLNYEKAAFALVNFETNSLPNQVHFKQNPDWNKIVSLLSRGEVKNLPLLPQPTMAFLEVCLSYELKKHPNAKSLEELDISCGLAHRSVLQNEEVKIKNIISDNLMEFYDSCQKVKKLSPKTQNTFLYLMGWPNAQQYEQLQQGKTNMNVVRESNLAQFKLGDLFDSVEKLLQSPEICAYNDPKIELYKKVLKFEKMILIPKNNFKPRTEKTR